MCTEIIIQKESCEVCEEPMAVDAQILICADHEEKSFCEELDNVTLIRAYNEFRRKRKLLLLEEIELSE